MHLTFSVDRLEEGVLVCYDEEKKKYEFPGEMLKMEVGMLFEADLDEEGNLSHIVPLEKETARMKAELSARTKSLFSRPRKHS